MAIHFTLMVANGYSKNEPSQVRRKSESSVGSEIGNVPLMKRYSARMMDPPKPVEELS